VGRLPALAALAVALAVPTAHGSAPKRPALQQYLAAMSWPMRASVLRTRSLAAAGDCAVRAGDPPCWRDVAASCRSLRAVEERGHLLGIVAPAALRASHAALTRAYSRLRDACAELRLTALGVAVAIERDEPKARPAVDAGRAALRRFERTRIAPFTAARRRWRTAALREAAAHPVAASWLQRLPSG
jgi:hypothetical protein